MTATLYIAIIGPLYWLGFPRKANAVSDPTCISRKQITTSLRTTSLFLTGCSVVTVGGRDAGVAAGNYRDIRSLTPEYYGMGSTSGLRLWRSGYSGGGWLLQDNYQNTFLRNDDNNYYPELVRQPWKNANYQVVDVQVTCAGMCGCGWVVVFEPLCTPSERSLESTPRS